MILALTGCGWLIPDAPVNGVNRPASVAPVRSTALADAGLVDAPVEGGTRTRIARAGSGLDVCMATLEAARVRFTPVPDRVNSETCGLTAAGVLGPDMGTVARMAPADATLTCETALAVSVWRRQSVEPAAREILGSDVVQIDHYGTYACRSVSNRPGARPSAHSRAAAIDIAGFRLRDGRRITVANDWSGSGPEAVFLRRIRDDACTIFGTALSPDYDAAHQDHLHLEPGRAFCR
ncbi:MAG: extensin [Alphaproteobacteria bacterium]|nr:MAG: extensin [Alphaproteobacteria bacterium]